MYHHSEGYPNASQHSNTEGSPAAFLCWYSMVSCAAVSLFPLAAALASVLPKESLNKLNSWKRLVPSAKQENNGSPHS